MILVKTILKNSYDEAEKFDLMVNGSLSVIIKNLEEQFDTLTIPIDNL